MEEAFLIGRECASMEGAALPVVLSHHKVTGKAHWGQTKRTLSRFDEASRLQPLALDVYPYDASSTVLKMDAARRSSKVVVTWSKAMPEADSSGHWSSPASRRGRCAAHTRRYLRR